MTHSDGSREESASASVLAGDFRAVLAGTADTGFAEKGKPAMTTQSSTTQSAFLV